MIRRKSNDIPTKYIESFWKEYEPKKQNDLLNECSLNPLFLKEKNSWSYSKPLIFSDGSPILDHKAG